MLFFLLPCFSPAQVSAAEPPDPHVLQFTPQGTVKKVRQVTARFSEPMVPLVTPILSLYVDRTPPNSDMSPTNADYN